MKIISLLAENVKRLVAVEIKPDGNLVEITGKNGHGKTSVLDSIWWALAGQTNVQAQPIRQGATKARIRLDLGDLIVTRTFTKREDQTVTSSITVENADGARFPSPQAVLDKLLGALCFDPLEFTRMKPREQFEVLTDFVPGVDFDAIAAANKKDFDERTEINRRARELRAAASRIELPHIVPAKAIDESALVAELAKAGETNTEVERARSARAIESENIAVLRRTARDQNERAAQLRAAAAECEGKAEAMIADADAKQATLNALDPLPDGIDVSEIQARIAAARDTNAAVRKRDERDAFNASADEADAQSVAISERMKARTAEKEAAIATASLPVEGITFGDGELLLNGVPLDQASDAEKLRASVAIAIASNPKLRVIRIRDGSLLDDEGMRLLAEMADAADCQIWCERVDSSGKVGFVLEDGQLKNAPAASPTEAAAR